MGAQRRSQIARRVLPFKKVCEYVCMYGRTVYEVCKWESSFGLLRPAIRDHQQDLCYSYSYHSYHSNDDIDNSVCGAAKGTHAIKVSCTLHRLM